MEDGYYDLSKKEITVTQDYPKISAKKYPLPKKLQREVRASLEDVKKVVASGEALILDVRPVELYTGEKGPWRRKGGIERV